MKKTYDKGNDRSRKQRFGEGFVYYVLAPLSIIGAVICHDCTRYNERIDIYMEKECRILIEERRKFEDLEKRIYESVNEKNIYKTNNDDYMNGLEKGEK